MKKLINLLLLLFISSSSYSQFGQCKCNDFFDKEIIRTTDQSFNRNTSKDSLYSYIAGSTETRKAKKLGLGLGSVTKTIIKALPVENAINISGNYENSKISNIYNRTIKNQFLSDEDLNIIIKAYIPKMAFDSYNQCLRSCERYAEITTNGGVTLRNVSQLKNTIILELKYISNPANQTVTIDRAIYSNGNVIGGRQFKKGTKVKDRQIIYEQIKLPSEEELAITVSFEEAGVGQATLFFPATDKLPKSTDAPIGTIVASLLPYDRFLELNGLKATGDINNIIWVPCDGRAVGTDKGTYGAYGSGVVPDLRGIFLRGANNMGFRNAAVPEPDPEYLNPQEKLVGQKQGDTFESHAHIITKQFKANGHSGGGIVGRYDGLAHWSSTGDAEHSTNKNGDLETRPKNITVYYYIKIR